MILTVGTWEEAVPSTCRSISNHQDADNAKNQRPVTDPKRSIPFVFNRSSRLRLDIRNSAAILRAVNRSNHKRPCTSSCSNEYKGKPGLYEDPKIPKT